MVFCVQSVMEDLPPSTGASCFILVLGCCGLPGAVRLARLCDLPVSWSCSACLVGGVTFLTNPAFTCQLRSRLPLLFSCTVSNALSNWMWYCRDTKPVVRSSTNATFLACSGDRPSYIPILDLFFFLCWCPPSWIGCANTYTGHPSGTLFSNVRFTFTFVKACSGLIWELSFMFVLSFHATHSNLSAYGHRCALIAAGHLWLACINWVRVRSCRTRILRSATPFWWCAPTPAYVILCLLIWQSRTHALLLNIPLSAW